MGVVAPRGGTLGWEPLSFLSRTARVVGRSRAGEEGSFSCARSLRAYISPVVNAVSERQSRRSGPASVLVRVRISLCARTPFRPNSPIPRSKIFQTILAREWNFSHWQKNAVFVASYDPTTIDPSCARDDPSSIILVSLLLVVHSCFRKKFFPSHPRNVNTCLLWRIIIFWIGHERIKDRRDFRGWDEKWLEARSREKRMMEMNGGGTVWKERGEAKSWWPFVRGIDGHDSYRKKSSRGLKIDCVVVPLRASLQLFRSKISQLAIFRRLSAVICAPPWSMNRRGVVGTLGRTVNPTIRLKTVHRLRFTVGTRGLPVWFMRLGLRAVGFKELASFDSGRWRERQTREQEDRGGDAHRSSLYDSLDKCQMIYVRLQFCCCDNWDNSISRSRVEYFWLNKRGKFERLSIDLCRVEPPLDW